MSLHSIFQKVSPRTRELIVGGVILLAVVASRHATLDHPLEMSGDESELLVQVDRYAHDLVPWRAVDGSTIGPVNPWFLLLVKQVGWPVGYRGIHFLAALLLGAIAATSYHTVRLFLPFRAAALVGLAGTITLCGSASINFMYYATELLPALLLGVALLALVAAGQRRPVSRGLLALSVACCGLAPWAKLQAAPMSLLLCAFAGWLAWRQAAVVRPLPARVASVVGLAALAVLPSVAILIAVWQGGVLADFQASYLVANLGYAGPFTPAAAASRLGQLVQQSQVNGLMAGVALLGLFCLFRFRSRPADADRPPWLTALACLYLGTAVFACIRPPYGFGHYHIFLITPLILALGALVRTASSGRPTEPGKTRRDPGQVAAATVLLPIMAAAIFHHVKEEPLRQYLAAMRRDATQHLPAVVSRAVKSLAPQASTLVVWGWMPSLYVESGLKSATRQTIGHFLIDEGPSRDFLRRQFLGDLRSAAPDVIIDAVASDCYTWYWPVKTSGIESFPEFAAYVQANYRLALSVTGDKEGVPLRVFVRKPPDGPRS